PEPPADEPAVAEQVFYLLRQRIRDDVEVLRMAAEQQIPHTATYQERFKPRISEPVQDLESVRRDVRAADVVFGTRNDRGARARRGSRIVQKIPFQGARKPGIIAASPRRGTTRSLRLAV